MVTPFGVYPTRHVVSLDGVTWTVTVQRGWVWPGWRWLDWLDRNLDGGEWNPVPVLALLAVPSVLCRRTSYLLEGRKDGRVTIYRGVQPEHRPRLAVLDEPTTDRAQANGRAEAVAAELRKGTFVAPQRASESR